MTDSNSTANLMKNQTLLHTLAATGVSVFLSFSLTSCGENVVAAAAAAAEEVKLLAYPAFHPEVRNVSDV